jgi:gliding motility-associated-like protein
MKVNVISILKTKQVLMALLCLFLFGNAIQAQTVSNRGKEFWVGYGHHQFMESGSNDMDMVLYLSTDAQAAQVKVTIFGVGNVALPTTRWERTYTIAPFTVISTGTTPANVFTAGAGAVGPMPKAGAIDCRLYSIPPPIGTGGSGIFQKKGILITSDVPIVAYAHIYASTSSGATMLLPTEAWGYSYVSLNSKQDYASNCYNWMYVIAKEDNTVVEITPSVLTRAQDKTGLAPGLTKTVILNKGEIYQVIGANDGADANGNGGGSSTGKELTGTKVRSVAPGIGACKPIAVFAGSSRTSNPASCGSGGGDNDNQQLFPQQAWGKRYLTTPFSGSQSPSSFGTSTYKIAVADPTTIVKRNGVVITGLQNGNFYKYESTTPDYIESDKPIMVCQFMTGGGCMPGGLGDPAMAVISPIEQAIKRTVFYRNSVDNITMGYLSLVVPTGGLPSLRIDNTNVFSYTAPHPNKAGYTIVVKQWTGTGGPSGTNKGQSIASCDSGFTAVTYGLGSVESYAYNAGTNLENLSALPGYYNTTDTSAINTVHPNGFFNIPMFIGAYFAYKPTAVTWKISALNSVISSPTPPLADITQNNPSPIDSTIIGSAKYYLYRLPGMYTFNNVGTFYLPIVLTSPDAFSGACSNEDNTQIPIVIKAKPTAGFTYTQNVICGIDSVHFTAPTQTPETLVVIKRKWYFTNNIGDTSNAQNPAFLFPTAGSYPVKLVILTQYGGIDSITISVNVQSGGQPSSPYTASATSICLGQTITFTPTSAVGGTTNWYWDFGNSTTQTLANNAAQNITYTTPGTYVVKHTIVGTGGNFPCPADTIKKTIIVAPVPVIDSTKGISPTNCGGNDGKILVYGLAANAAYTIEYVFNSATVNVPLVADANGVVTIANLGIGTYTNIKAKLGTCTSNIIASTVLTNPAAPAAPVATSNGPICAGTALNLTASTTTNGSFNWTGPGGFTSTNQNPTINAATVANSGNYSVTLTQNNCVSAAGTINVVVTVNPVITSTSKVDPSSCGSATGSILLNGLLANTSYTVTYLYSANNQSVSITSSAGGVVTIPNLSAGAYSNIRVALNTCASDPVGPINLVDPSSPATPSVTSNSPICEGSALNLVALSATTGVSYSWTGPDGFATTTQNPTLATTSATSAGVYSVKATLNGCSSIEATVSVVIKPVPVIGSTNGNNPTACATSTGSITLSGLTANSLFTVKYTKNSTLVTVDLTADGSGIVTIPNLPAGSYSSFSVTLNGCTSTTVAGPISLSDPTPPATPVVSGSISLCTGEQLSLTASSTTPGVSYRWTGPNSFTSTSQNPTIPNANTAATGSYAVTATLNSCTSPAALVNVVVNTTPVITSSSRISPVTCGATTGSITLNGLAANTSYTVDYTKGSTPISVTLVSNGSGVITIGSLSADTYSAISVTLGVCKSNVVGPLIISDPVPPATPTISNNGPLCVGSTLNLTSNSTTAGVTYVWTGPNGFTATTKNVLLPNSTTIMSGAYIVTVSVNNCTSTATTNVVVNPNPTVDFSTTPFVCMPNGVVTFTNNSTIDAGTLNYSWNFGDGSPLSTATNPTKVYATSGNYAVKLTATSGAGCSKNLSKNFNQFFSRPIANFKATPDTLCQGTTNTFQDLSTAASSTITTRSWNFGDSSIWINSASLTQTKLYTKPGNYQVKLVVSNTQGCISDTAKKIVRVYLQPIVDAGPTIVVPQGSPVQMAPIVNDSTTVNFKWTPIAGLSSSTTLRPTFIALDDKLYTLKAIGLGQCTASDTVFVKVLKTVIIPNAFSPNGDGNNDRWEIKNLGDYSFASVEVYNRYGQLVYESKGYSQPWDGTYRGKSIPVATYYYIIKFNNKFPTLTGSITLIR